jgi:hypothetical protein
MIWAVASSSRRRAPPSSAFAFRGVATQNPSRKGVDRKFRIMINMRHLII